MQNANKKDLTIVRVLDIPIEMVWRGWTDPKLVRLWWGPADYTSPSCEIDLREGGRYLFCMRAPQEQGGQDFYSTGIYSTIIPMERLEFTQHLSDPDGNPIDPAQVGMPADFPFEVRLEITFKALDGGRTELTIVEHGWSEGHMSTLAELGMRQSLDKFAASIG
ncbi:SRPBCC family protein [Paenibacillus cymbidii]|uniref:SRPBCC family protein n=1 Tax=Paenibacillus cymbidii TaxID=1639034 RepID=UPI0010806070|nr:SRPBCC domain-containing protein [Paenibacillus cymbidii]